MEVRQEKINRPNLVDGASVIQVIETRVLVGEGTAIDPKKLITQYWSLSGTLLATDDPLKR